MYDGDLEVAKDGGGEFGIFNLGTCIHIPSSALVQSHFRPGGGTVDCLLVSGI